MAKPKVTVGPKSDKIWREAIHRAVKRVAAGQKDHKLEHLADQLVQEGLVGNVSALKEIGDRLDGKAVQPIAGADGKGPVQIETIERVIVDPADKDS